jgi:hypothetical protein
VQIKRLFELRFVNALAMPLETILPALTAAIRNRRSHLRSRRSAPALQVLPPRVMPQVGRRLRLAASGSVWQLGRQHLQHQQRQHRLAAKLMTNMEMD